jgi:hypothetical protein
MSRDYELNRTRHEYNRVEPDEALSYTETTTPTEDTHPREPGPPLEFGTSMPRSRESPRPRQSTSSPSGGVDVSR